MADKPIGSAPARRLANNGIWPSRTPESTMPARFSSSPRLNLSALARRASSHAVIREQTSFVRRSGCCGGEQFRQVILAGQALSGSATACAGLDARIHPSDLRMDLVLVNNLAGFQSAHSTRSSNRPLLNASNLAKMSDPAKTDVPAIGSTKPRFSFGLISQKVSPGWRDPFSWVEPISGWKAQNRIGPIGQRRGGVESRRTAGWSEWWTGCPFTAAFKCGTQR
jgi:hypothetical protein